MCMETVMLSDIEALETELSIAGCVSIALQGLPMIRTSLQTMVVTSSVQESTSKSSIRHSQLRDRVLEWTDPSGRSKEE